MFTYQQARFPQKHALASREGRHWKYYSTEACVEAIDQVSAGLIRIGLSWGEKAAIVSEAGSPLWNFLDLGMQQLGVVVVPIHTSIGKEEVRYILKDARVGYCFTAERKAHQLVLSLQSELLDLKKILPFYSDAENKGFDAFMTPPSEKHLETIQASRAAIHEDDLATIVYTSGTEGSPRGVMLSHKNIVSNIKSVIPLIPINRDKRALSFLPLSHIFERMVTYTYIATGASLHYATGTENLLEEISETRPHYFSCVPRILEKFYEAFRMEYTSRSRLHKRLFKWAMTLSNQKAETANMSIGYWLKLIFAQLLVFRKWRRSLGNKLEGIVVGAAALPERLARIFHTAGIEIREGYGLTETSPVVTFNRFEPGGFRFGTVGIPVPGVNVRIERLSPDKEGEIMIKGPNVMMGYFGREKETQAAINPEGWLYTGDLGTFVDKRFLKITGRKKDLFKTSSGKYVAPLYLEQKLKSSVFVEQCLVFGANRPFVSALIIPSIPALKEWCEENGVHWTAPQFMVINPKVLERMKEEIENINEELPTHSKIREFVLLHKRWTQEGGEITLTFKPKRSEILKKYHKQIEEIYH